MTGAAAVLVVDASVAIMWVRREAGSDWALALPAGAAPLMAPDLLPIECANAFWRFARRGEEGVPEPGALLDRLLAMPVELVPSLGLLAREALRLALRLDHPVYDCLYLALALDRGAALATADGRFARAVRRAGALAEERLLVPPATGP